jgi:hypothetical protein
MKTKRWMNTSCWALLIFAFGLAAPALAWSNDSEKPGSVLVFHKFLRGTFNDLRFSGETVHAVTEIEISVVCPPGETCANDRVRLRAHWVCPGCTESSFNLETTVGGSLYFNPEGVDVIAGVVVRNVFPSNATTIVPLPPCPKGYLIVWAVNANGNAIKFDGLIGNAVIRENNGAGTGGYPGMARAYNAIPIQAAEGLNTGDLTDQDGQGELDFDGSEYKAITGKIFGTVRYEKTTTPSPVETNLTLLTLDVASNRPNPFTNVGLNFYTADEQFVDTGTSFQCWSEQRLTNILPSLTADRMGRKGLVESTSAEQQLDFFTTVLVTLLGVIETKEFDSVFPGLFRDYSYSLYNDGNPVETTFKP